MQDMMDRNRLPLKQYSLILSGTNVTGTTRAVGVPYITIDGTWRLRFNFAITSNSVTSITDLVISGVSISTAYAQALAASGPSSNLFHGRTTTANQIQMYAGVAVASWLCSGDIELASKPLFVN